MNVGVQNSKAWLLCLVAFLSLVAGKKRQEGAEEKHWDISPWFKALDLYVAPQRWEGFGLTPLEAMACGVPVVATRAGAFEDLVADGQTGRLVDIEDIDALTRATAELLDDPAIRAQWSANAVRHVEEKFRIEIEAGAINAIYRELLEVS